MKEKIAEIKALIAADELPEAFEQVKKILFGHKMFDDLIQLEAQFNKVKREFRQGILDTKERDLLENKVRANLLELLNDFERLSSPRIEYGFPILQELSPNDKDFVTELLNEDDIQELLFFRKRYHEEIKARTQLEAQKALRKKIGLFELETADFVTTEYEMPIGLSDGETVSVAIVIRLTPKGINWIKYLKETHKVKILD